MLRNPLRRMSPATVISIIALSTVGARRNGTRYGPLTG